MTRSIPGTRERRRVPGLNSRNTREKRCCGQFIRPCWFIATRTPGSGSCATVWLKTFPGASLPENMFESMSVCDSNTLSRCWCEMQNGSRTVFHVDMDAFFVSVEELYDPSLRGKPVVVGGQKHERGVVSAASYEARKFGVHSAMPLRTAARLCPHAIFVEGHPDRYRACSVKVYSVLTSFSPRVEMVSIDEAYLDMSGTERLHGP